MWGRSPFLEFGDCTTAPVVASRRRGLEIVEMLLYPGHHRGQVGGHHDEIVAALDRARREGPARAVHAGLLPVLVCGVGDPVAGRPVDGIGVAGGRTHAA